MSKVLNENYITIQGFMVNELHLKGNELLIYAIIYGFSQTEGQKFTGSLQYLCDWTNSTKQGVMKSLKSLLEKGFIVKEVQNIRGVNIVDYHSTKFNGGIQQSLMGGKQSLMGGGKQSLPNNIDIYNKDYIINDNIDKKNITKKETEIFDYWNDRNIIVHQKLTEPILTAIKKALKTYSVEEIETAIDRYDMILKDKDYFFSYIWSLKEFLNRQKGIADFLDDGEKWLNYSKVRVSEQKNKNKQNDIIRNVMQKLGEN